MDLDEIRRLRLYNQQILSTTCEMPAEIVAHFGAMQAQEYAMAKWAIGLRLKGTTEAEVEAAFQTGHILRTHLLRPTWHFVTPEDIRWMLALTAPQVHKVNKTMYRKTDLSAEVFTQANRVIVEALTAEGRLTRVQLAERLEQARIPASGHRLAYIMMNAELEGLICSGPRNGKQFTYTLLDDQAPSTAPLTREEALVKLADRYFSSRGPATVQDFANWSGLALADARFGTASLDAHFTKASFDDREFFFIEPPISPMLNERATFLLPDYDEYGMGYKDRSALAPRRKPQQEPSIYSHWLVIQGHIEGTWRPAANRSDAPTLTPYFKPSAKPEGELHCASKRYQEFWH